MKYEIALFWVLQLLSQFKKRSVRFFKLYLFRLWFLVTCWCNERKIKQACKTTYKLFFASNTKLDSYANQYFKFLKNLGVIYFSNRNSWWLCADKHQIFLLVKADDHWIPLKFWSKNELTLHYYVTGMSLI